VGGLYFGAIGALLALVTGIYLLKPPPRRWVVPSNLLWEQVLRQSRKVMDRWRWWMSLLLTALIACLIATALLQTSPGVTAAGGRLVLVVDDSATMATRTSDGRDRFQHALARARVLIQQHASILVADTAHRLPAPVFGDRDAALQALEKLQVSYADGAEFPPIAQARVDQLLVKAVFVSDGVEIPAVPAGVEVVSVFEPAFNVGITAFDVRLSPGDASRAQALVEVSNAAPESVVAEIEVTDRDGRRAQSRLSPGAMQGASTMIDVSELADGPLAARIRSPGDALAIDDVAYAWSPARRSLRVGLVTRGSEFLEKALRAVPRVQLSVMSPADYRDAETLDMWVFDRFSPRQAPAHASLSFHPPNATWLPQRMGDRVNPTVHGWNAGHPLLENLALDDLLIDHAQSFSPTDALVLLKSRHDAALIVAQESNPRRVAVGFSLEESNFALNSGFPLFLANSLNWLSAEPSSRARTLGTVMIPMRGARVVGMDGKEVETITAPQGSVFQADRPGIFTAVNKESVERVAVNVFSSRVSQVNASKLQPMAETVIVAKPVTAMPLWRLWLMLACGLLLVEWWTWNRHMTV
jgi:hypothetical protein